MTQFLNACLWLVHSVLWLTIWVLIINAILSWLIAFDVINRSNRLVATVWDFTTRLMEPLLKPIRRVVPLIGGVDLSPLVLILAIGFIQQLIPRFIY